MQRIYRLKLRLPSDAADSHSQFEVWLAPDLGGLGHG